jgi:hypothetical protein
MRDSRAQIIAALQSGGGLDVETLANETLARAGCGPGAEPSRIVIGLEWAFRILPVAALRGSFDGQRVSARWDRDAQELGLNELIGISRALDMVRNLRATVADIYRLAGHLTMPGLDRFDIGPGCQFLPPWFVQALRRRLSDGYGSGVWPAVSAAAR